MREIRFYQTASGDCPVEDFLAGLGPKQAQKVAWVLRVVRELPMAPQQKEKSMKDDLENHAEDVRLSTLERVARALGKTLRIELVEAR